MDKILYWILPEAEKLASWVVKDLTGVGKLEEWVMEKEARGTLTSGIFMRNDRINSFEILKKQNPEKVRKQLCKITQDYNNGVNEFLKTHPMSSFAIWNSYRKWQATTPSATMSGLLNSVSDDEFAFRYMYFMERTANHPDNYPPEIAFDIKSPFTLVEHDLSYLHYVGRYKFRDSKGKEVSTIWDLREKDLPRFKYS